MPTLIDVRAALKNGEKDRARQLLKQVLKEKPSADAWFLAARMSDNRDSAIKNLQRALVMDPKHVQAQRALEDYGVKKVSGLKAITMEVSSSNNPAMAPPSGGVMGRLVAMPRWVLLVATGVILAVTLCMLIGMLSSGGGGAEAPAPTWTPRPFGLWTPDVMASHLRYYGLPVTEIGGATEGTPVRGRIVFEITDAAGVVQQLRILFYDSEDDAFNDQPRLNDLGWTEWVFNRNAMMYFPSGLDEGTTRRAVDIFDAAVDPAQVQSAIQAATATASAPTADPNAALTPTADPNAALTPAAPAAP